MTRSTSPLGYVSILGETGEPTLGWKEGSGLYFLLLQEQLKGIIIRTTESTPFRQPTVSAATENLAETPPRSPAPVSIGGRSGLGVCVLLLQDLLQSCARGGRRRVEDMCYEG